MTFLLVTLIVILINFIGVCAAVFDIYNEIEVNPTNGSFLIISLVGLAFSTISFTGQLLNLTSSQT
jgi:hypothetical protein